MGSGYSAPTAGPAAEGRGPPALALGPVITEGRRSDVRRGSVPSVDGEWERGPLIGQGAAGAVYEAWAVGGDPARRDVFAVKEVSFSEDMADNPADVRRFEALRVEIALLQEIHHRNVVRFLGLDRIGFSMYIMMEFVPGGSIQQLTKRFRKLPDRVAARFTAQILEGLVYLHRKNIIHRDIKGANVIVGDDGVVKLADFGAAKRVLDAAQLQHTLAGTPYWMAPEVVRQAGHSRPADVWSLGATVLQMLTGFAPYQDLAPVPALYKIGHSSCSPLPADAAVSDAARDFMGGCLRRDASRRPTVAELARHPWLRPAEPVGEEERAIQAYLIELSRSHGLSEPTPAPAPAPAGALAGATSSPNDDGTLPDDVLDAALKGHLGLCGE